MTESVGELVLGHGQSRPESLWVIPTMPSTVLSTRRQPDLQVEATTIKNRAKEYSCAT